MRPIIRYWGRKAGDLAEYYINKYTQPKDIVLDPFGGSGSIARKILLMGRKCIYSDLNPLAALIARVDIEGVDTRSLKIASTNLFRRQRLYYRDESDNLHWMNCSRLYEIICRCGAKRQVLYFLWYGDAIIAAKVKCKCGNPLIKYSGYDYNINIIYEYPKARLMYDNGLPFLKRRQINTISELFTRRNIIILAALLKDIKKLKTNEQTRRALLVAFASILYQASKMSRLSGGTWAVNCYWIPKFHVERNPYFLFQNALRRLERIRGLAIAHTCINPVIYGNASLAILNNDAKELPLPDNSIHLVVTDPPFTDEIQYFELSYMAAAWLDMLIQFDKEIIVNRNQGKGFNEYCNLLTKSFTEMYRVLKPKHKSIIMIHDEDEEIRNILIELVKSSGFIIDKIKKERMSQRNIGDRDEIKGKELIILDCKKP